MRRDAKLHKRKGTRHCNVSYGHERSIWLLRSLPAERTHTRQDHLRREANKRTSDKVSFASDHTHQLLRRYCIFIKFAWSIQLMQSLEPLKGDTSDYLLQGCCSGFKRRQGIFISAPTFDWRCVKCCVCYILLERTAAILWVLKSCDKCLLVVWMVTRTPAVISRQPVQTQSAGWHLLSWIRYLIGAENKNCKQLVVLEPVHTNVLF